MAFFPHRDTAHTVKEKFGKKLYDALLKYVYGYCMWTRSCIDFSWETRDCFVHQRWSSVAVQGFCSVFYCLLCPQREHPWHELHPGPRRLHHNEASHLRHSGTGAWLCFLYPADDEMENVAFILREQQPMGELHLSVDPPISQSPKSAKCTVIENSKTSWMINL